MNALRFQTPFGIMMLAEENDRVTHLFFHPFPLELNSTPLLRKAEAELTEYFAGKRTRFTIPLAPDGSPFQAAVWEQLRTIPYGCTATYGEIASRIGNPSAARAVGQACNRNPIPILIPCHRVVGKKGCLTGFAGGLPLKQSLLSLETKQCE